MLKTRYFVIVAAMIAAATWATAADKNAAAEKQAKLIEIIESHAPPREKATACKQLAIYGSKDAVPALATLLPDAQLSSWARIALEAIPDPAADEALRASLEKVQGRLLVGVINSIGVRRDAKSVPSLIERLKDGDAGVVSAAAVALGCIGGSSAADALTQSMTAAPAAARDAIAEGCILCAEKFLGKRGQSPYAGTARRVLRTKGDSPLFPESVKLYDLVRKADVPKPRVLQATRGAILARGAAGIPLLVEQLRSADKALFALGLGVAREIPGGDVTDVLIAELDRATAERQALLISALAERDEPKATTAVLKAIESRSTVVRLAAVRGLGRSGNRSCVPVLLKAATDSHAELAETALAILADLAGKEVDADLAALLQKAEGPTRLVLIRLAGQRCIATTNSLLLKAVDDPDVQVRCAALTALGSTISPADLPILIARATDPAKPAEAKAAREALRATGARTTDRDGFADKVLAALASAPTASKCILLDSLLDVGGSKALAAVSAAANDADPAVRNAAYRTLGKWTSADAGPVLLALAKTPGDDKLQTRALRAYIRVARQFNIPDRQRLAMYGDILSLAKRDEERRLALAVLKRVVSTESLALAVRDLDNPSLQEAAARVAVAISQKLVTSQPAAVAGAMEKVLRVTKDRDLSAKAAALLEQSRKK
jgi:HEAT repeat protein